jgi:hypothetical protein
MVKRPLANYSTNFAKGDFLRARIMCNLGNLRRKYAVRVERFGRGHRMSRRLQLLGATGRL